MTPSLQLLSRTSPQTSTGYLHGVASGLRLSMLETQLISLHIPLIWCHCPRWKHPCSSPHITFNVHCAGCTSSNCPPTNTEGQEPLRTWPSTHVEHGPLEEPCFASCFSSMELLPISLCALCAPSLGGPCSYNPLRLEPLCSPT